MSRTLPPSRLTDVLRRNSMETLKRHGAELAAASSMLSAEGMQTRFLRNHFLINPKSLHLLTDELTLSRHHLFAVYKPPFCPMRRSEAHQNYHKVSVESFVNAALRSQMILPVLTRSIRPQEMKVRVLHDVDTFASGPVLISISDKHPHATSLQGFTFEYDVAVAGHILKTTMGGGAGPRPIEMGGLFPEVAEKAAAGATTSAPGSPASGHDAPSGTPCQCSFEVVMHGYYSVHPVSLLNVKITSPPTPLPPNIESFVREKLDTCVIGDPVALGEFLEASQQQQQRDSRPASAGSGLKAAMQEEPVAPLMRSHVVSMRGDCDFPRVFTHLREVYFDVPVRDVNGDTIGKKKVEFHCRKCFDSVLQRSRNFSLKANRIGLLDGSWTPSTEYM